MMSTYIRLINNSEYLRCWTSKLRKCNLLISKSWSVVHIDRYVEAHTIATGTKRERLHQSLPKNKRGMFDGIQNINFRLAVVLSKFDESQRKYYDPDVPCSCGPLLVYRNVIDRLNATNQRQNETDQRSKTDNCIFYFVLFRKRLNAKLYYMNWADCFSFILSSHFEIRKFQNYIAFQKFTNLAIKSDKLSLSFWHHAQK